MSQTTYERTVTAAILLTFVVVGWGPGFWHEWADPNPVQPMQLFLLAYAAMAILAAGLLFEAAHVITRTGKALYTLAIFFSLPLTGMVIAGKLNPAATVPALLSAGALWFLSKARGDNRPYLLAMLWVLACFTALLFGPHPAVLAIALSVLLAKPFTRADAKVLGLVLLSLGVGLLIRPIAFVRPDVYRSMVSPHNAQYVLALLPWFAWLVPLAILPGLTNARRIAAGAAIALLTVGALADFDILSIAGALAPLVAILIADYFLDCFAESGQRRGLVRLAPLIAMALTILGLFVTHVLVGAAGLTLTQWSAAPLIILAFVLHVAAQPRWAFAAWALCGLLCGSLSVFAIDSSIDRNSALGWSALACALLAAAGSVLFRVMFGRRAEFDQTAALDKHVYGSGEFRRFHDTIVWSGRSVPLSAAEAAPYTFAIFGDVTGADSVVGTRQGGYFGFKRLLSALKAQQTDFCIALGDLAANAKPLPYRRVRQMLRKISAPLLVTPGNHDLFDVTTYDTRLFLGLFGADHHSFVRGPVHFLLLNNALGNLTAEQFAWVEHELSSHPALIKLCFCHKPIFDPRPGESYAMEWRPHAERLHDLFKLYGVRAVFSGHIHSLLSAERDGVLYVISGGAGSKIVAGGAAHHFLTCAVDSAGVTLRALPLDGSTTPLFTTEFRTAE